MIPTRSFFWTLVYLIALFGGIWFFMGCAPYTGPVYHHAGRCERHLGSNVCADGPAYGARAYGLDRTRR
jgi:hypothetical protein